MSQFVRLSAVLVAALLTVFTLTASALSVELTAPSVPGVATPPDARRGGFTPPVQGGTVSQAFGCTPFAFEPPEPACHQRHWHSGIDFAVPIGTRVVATLGGRVRVRIAPGGYGLHLVVDHGGGLSSLYGHLSEVAVPDGARVETGVTIGLAGSTGNSTGPHLHFEIRRDGIAEDPRLDLARS